MCTSQKPTHNKQVTSNYLKKNAGFPLKRPKTKRHLELTVILKLKNNIWVNLLQLPSIKQSASKQQLFLILLHGYILLL